MFELEWALCYEPYDAAVLPDRLPAFEVTAPTVRVVLQEYPPA